MKITMERMKGPRRFGLHDILEQGLPKCDPPGGEVFASHLETVKTICKNDDLDFSKATLDTSAGRKRDPEWAYDMLPCVRPSHRVWLCGESRYAEPLETLRAHGVFPETFPNPQALADLEPKLALDLAGNAFSTSVLMAKVLCTLVNADPWEELAKSTSEKKPGLLKKCSMNASKLNSSNAQGRGQQREEGPIEPPSKKRRANGQSSKKRKAPDHDPEQGGRTDKIKQKRGHNLKGSILSIGKKMEILLRYDELKKNSKHPEKDFVLGCV